MKKLLLITNLLILVFCAYTAFQYVYFVDGKLHITVCDVGQGESILITTPKRYHILIDGGPDMAVLDCLAKHLPYWERTIDIVILTHPHTDHFNGIHYIVDRYTVKRFFTEKVQSENPAYLSLLKKLETQHIHTDYVFKSDQLITPDKVTLDILGPDAMYIDLVSSGTPTAENASVITLLRYGELDYLFAGDSPYDYLLSQLGTRRDIDILELPHHGSKTSTNEEVLQLVTPELGIASMGKKNKYGHPSVEVVKELERHHIPLLRTDEKGSISTISDGKTWQVRAN